MKNKWALQIALVIFFISPFLLLFQFAGEAWTLDWDEVQWVLRSSLKQSLVSGLLSTALGLWLSWGLFYTHREHLRWFPFKLFFLMPTLFPTLFVLIGVMNLFDPLPMGFIGVVIANVFINVGLVAVILKEATQNKLLGLADVSMLMGASWVQFFSRVYLPVMKRDLWQVFFMVFIFTFSNFSVSLILGGGKETNLDILIYEKLKINNDWSAAFYLTVFQSVFLFLFASLTSFTPATVKFMKTSSQTFIESRWAFYSFTILYVLFIRAYGLAVFEGASQWKELLSYKQEILSGLSGTILVSMGVGFLITAFLVVLLSFPKSSLIHRFLLGLTTRARPWSVFHFFVGGNSPLLTVAKIVVGLSLISVVIIYKMGFESLINDISIYRDRAELLGASELLILKKVIWPLSQKRVLFFSGMGAFWASGDFGVSKMLSSKDLTLALLSESFLSHYRIGIASLMSLLVVCVGLICFSIFAGASIVISRKTNY